MNHFLKAIGAAAVLIAGTASAMAQAFPVTIDHALGSTTIESEPQRIVVLGWSAQDTLLALGVVPVGTQAFSYGGDDIGLLPWTREAIEKLGGTLPTMISEGDLPIETIAGLAPDLILAPYSGFGAAEYELLSQIAPTVAYPGAAWSTSWEDIVTITGTAIGKKAEAEALVADTTKFMQDEVAKYPELAGTTFATTLAYDGQVAVHTDTDTRVIMLKELGMVPATQIEGADTSGGYYSMLSFENFDRITADVIISFFDSQASADDFYGRSYVANAIQPKRGSVAKIVGEENAMSIGAVSPLSIRWGFPAYIAAIAEAARNAGR